MASSSYPQYAPGTYTGQPGQPPARIAPARNQTGRPPNGPGSGGMPSYEEMIVAALDDISDPEGLAPKTVFDYMSQCVRSSIVLIVSELTEFNFSN